MQPTSSVVGNRYTKKTPENILALLLVLLSSNLLEYTMKLKAQK